MCFITCSHICRNFFLLSSRCKSDSFVNVQVELLELLAEIDYKFVVYLESVGFSSPSTVSHRFLGVSCNWSTASM